MHYIMFSKPEEKNYKLNINQIKNLTEKLQINRNK